MNNLFLYIQMLQCNSLETLLNNIKVEGNTVMVPEEIYGEIIHEFSDYFTLDCMSIVDSIIYKTTKCQFFKYIEAPDRRYYWRENMKQYISEYPSFQLCP